MHSKVSRQDCPLCFSKESFQSWMALKDALISLSMRSFTCPLGCPGHHEGLDKFALHLVSHDMELKQQQALSMTSRTGCPSSTTTTTVPDLGHVDVMKKETPDGTGSGLIVTEGNTISIKDCNHGSDNVNNSNNTTATMDTLDELLADFTEFVRQEDNSNNQGLLPTMKLKAPNPLRTSPKAHHGHHHRYNNNLGLYPSIQTPLPMSQINAMQQQKLQTTKTPPPPLLHMSSMTAAPQQSPNNVLLNPTNYNNNIQVPSPLANMMSPSLPLAPPPTPLTPLNQVQPLPVQDDQGLNNVNDINNGSDPGGGFGSGTTGKQVQCELCGWNFDNESFLQLHVVLMHSKRSQAVFQRRMRQAVDEFKCRDCNNASFKVYEEFVNHLRVVHNDHRFVCHICAKIFKLRGSLLVHLRVVHNPLGDGGYHCKVCNRKFTNKNRRDVHEKKHADTRQFECAKCGMTFEEKPDFDQHMESHKTEHKCSICSRTFYTQAALLIHSAGHQKSNHENPNPDIDDKIVSGDDLNQGFKCGVCDKVFKRECHLNQHAKVHENKEWECDVCKKTFTTKYFLRKHKRLHTGETPYACNICGKSFTFQQSYHKHMLYHTDDKPYSCSQCGRAFKELSTLQNHERIHSGERPFACETCGKSFRQRVSYLVHRRIHTGVMPYVCNICGKCFRYKVTQRTHKCLGKGDQDQDDQQQQPHQPQQLPLPVQNPLSESNAMQQQDGSFQGVDLPQQIRDDLLSFRRLQGRRLIKGRIHSYLQKSKDRANQSEIPSPVGFQMQQLSLSDQTNQSQSLPNIDAIDSGGTGSGHKEHDTDSIFHELM